MSDFNFDENNKSNNLILFPDVERLREEVAELREELASLVSELNELCFVICRNLEAKYLIEFGGLEYNIHQSDCELRRLKRKMELIQARINRREQVEMEQIEQTLDDEFEEYEKKLEALIGKVNDALIYSSGKFMTEEETAEFKRMYHNIVRKLHPDLNPDLSPAKKELYQRAVEAYESGDGKAMSLIAEMVKGESSRVPDENTEGGMYDEKKRLEALREGVQNDIEQVKSQFPYTEKVLLEDPDAIVEKRQKLENIQWEYQESITVYKMKIADLMR